MVLFNSQRFRKLSNLLLSLFFPASKVGTRIMMNDIYIPSYRLVQDTKPYYVYLIQVCARELGLFGTVEKRYSAFHSLHRELRKQFSTPPFPPKRIRCSQVRVLEQRRKELETYLQTMFHFVPSRNFVTNFLGLSLSSNHSVNSDNHHHQPIFKLENSMFTKRTGLPNIIKDGVLDALYGSANQVS
ncbi:sorting nexin-24-like [Cimex lectularius]|uniref:PX domain-containing protein n=1 Tax=Cimex lectularius TaxID=79782 RepID=A0A8I6RHZ2_CIMLE|nr:sorting nexin-24-like [Cimex lectularius]